MDVSFYQSFADRHDFYLTLVRWTCFFISGG